MIPLHPPPGDTSTERTVQIDGSSDQIEAAKVLVNEVISEVCACMQGDQAFAWFKKIYARSYLLSVEFFLSFVNIRASLVLHGYHSYFDCSDMTNT